MRLSFVAAALGAAAGVAFVDAFDANSNANMAVYYGQNSRNIVGAQGTLASYCQGISCCSKANRRFNVGYYSIGVSVYLF
jgi:hypothetical protein